MDLLKCSGKMSFLEGHVADCNSSLGGWFSGRVSYFGAERYDSSVSLLEIALKYRNRIHKIDMCYASACNQLINIRE